YLKFFFFWLYEFCRNKSMLLEHVWNEKQEGQDEKKKKKKKKKHFILTGFNKNKFIPLRSLPMFWENG
ncbi:hypothetical protein ACMBCM_06800, partial [Spiroplasma sp. K1]